MCSSEYVVNPYWASITEPSYQVDDIALEGADVLGSYGCELIGLGSVQSIELVNGDVIAGLPGAWPYGSCVQNLLAIGMAARIRSSETPSVIQWLYESNPTDDFNALATSVGAAGGFLALGAPRHMVDSTEVGRIDLFSFNAESDSWAFAYQVLSGDDRVHFGQRLAGSDNWLAVGNTNPSYAPPDAAAISILQAPSFTSGVTIDAPPESGPYFGLSLDIHERAGTSDEAFLLAGSPASAWSTDEFNGAYVYRTTNGQWSPTPTLLTPEEWHVGQIGDADHRTDCFKYGFSVALTEAGGSVWAFVGDPHFDAPGCHTFDTEDSNEAGCVYVYRYANEAWTQVQRIHAPDCILDGHFGWSLAADEGIVVVGAPESGGQDPNAPPDPHGSYDGAVYILRYSDGGWILAERLDRVCGPSDHHRVGHAVDVEVMDTGDIHIVSGSGLESQPSMTEWIIASELDVEVDCNANGILDTAELGAGVARDANGDDILDQCQLDELDHNGNGVPDDFEQSESNRLAVVFLIEGAEATSQQAFDLQIAGLMNSVGQVESAAWPLDGRAVVTVVDEHGPIEPFKEPVVGGDSVFLPLLVSPDDDTKTTLTDLIGQLTKANAIDNFRYYNKRIGKARAAIDDLAAELGNDGDDDTSIDQYRRLFIILGDDTTPGLGADDDCPFENINGVWDAMRGAAHIRFSAPRTRICAGLLGSSDVLESDAAKVLRLITNMSESPTLQVTDDVGEVHAISVAADVQELCAICGDGLIGSPACQWDLNGDGVVNVDDILIVISGYGDIYTVDDLLAVLAEFGCAADSHG